MLIIECPFPICNYVALGKLVFLLYFLVHIAFTFLHFVFFFLHFIFFLSVSLLFVLCHCQRMSHGKEN